MDRQSVSPDLRTHPAEEPETAALIHATDVSRPMPSIVGLRRNDIGPADKQLPDVGAVDADLDFANWPAGKIPGCVRAGVYDRPKRSGGDRLCLGRAVNHAGVGDRKRCEDVPRKPA